ncbi:MAG: PAS domain S-box protein [Desulfatibacillum sp.]|nr:PAS domain S-box protein [Desulfatibacillum sp.]
MKPRQSEEQLTSRIQELETEISRYENANKGLTAVEKHYRTLVENTTDVSWKSGLDLRLEYLSPSVMNFMGFAPEELHSLLPKDLFSSKSMQVVTQKLGELLECARSSMGAIPKTVSFEAEVLCKDGSTKWAEVTGAVLRDKNGKALGIYGISRDITHRKTSEKALEEKDQSLFAQTQKLEEISATLRKASMVAGNAVPMLQQYLRITLESMVLPYLDRLLTMSQDVEQTALVSVLRSNMIALLSHVSGQIQDPLPELSSKELEVAWLVRNGETSQNIAQAMNISKRSVDFYRGKLRKKFGLEGPGDSLTDRLAYATLPRRTMANPSD